MLLLRLRDPRRWLPIVLLCATLCATSCVAPRTIISTGKVTPRGEFRVGGNAAFNIGTAAVSKGGSALKSAVQNALGKDTVRYDQSITDLQAAALAYVVDPVQPTADLYLRYGVIDRLDAGYKYAFGSHVFDVMYQFLGPTGTPEHPAGRSGDTYASIGLQYATQRAKLPGLSYLDNLTNLVGFRASRHDLIVPLVFSHSFGPRRITGRFPTVGLRPHVSQLRLRAQQDLPECHCRSAGAKSARPAHQQAELLLLRRLRQREDWLPLRLRHPGPVPLLPALRHVCPAQQPHDHPQRPHHRAQHRPPIPHPYSEIVI